MSAECTWRPSPTLTLTLTLSLGLSLARPLNEFLRRNVRLGLSDSFHRLSRRWQDSLAFQKIILKQSGASRITGTHITNTKAVGQG